MNSSLPKLTSIPQNVIAAMGRTKKAKKVSIPKVSQSSGKSILKGLISRAKSQVSGLSKSAGVKTPTVKMSLAKSPSIKAPKLSTSLKRGLSRLG